MADPDEKMVLRTVYLPRELDEKLRVAAFRAGKTKNELVREAVRRGLETPPQLFAKGKGSKAKQVVKARGGGKAKAAKGAVAAPQKAAAG